MRMIFNDRRVMDTSMIPRKRVQQYRLVYRTKKAAGRKTDGFNVSAASRAAPVSKISFMF
jgi:hypothetical protein